jgi:cytochrome c556
MIRTVFAAACAALVVLGVGMAVAQQDVIKERKGLMKANGDMAKLGAAMMKGEAPFDMDDFKARFVKFGNDAKAADTSVTDLDSFKAALSNIGKTDCGACHELYRAKHS